MPDLTRRRFLGGAAAVAGATGLGLLPPSMKKVLAATPDATLQSRSQVEHVLIMIQENRSFDHYFGTLSGVQGFDDPNALTLSTGRSVFYQPDTLNPDGYELPFHLDMTKTSAAAIHDLSHAWTAQHQSWNGGRMDNWLPAHRAADGAYGPLTMGYFERSDIPFHYALADAFTICDGYHCAAYAPTWPNRIIAMTGTNDPTGANGGPCVSNVLPASGAFTWKTYAERLQAAGVSWRSYQTATSGSELSWFKAFQDAPTSSPLYQNGLVARPGTAVMDDIRSNSLPQVSWIHSTAQEHPSDLPAAGAAYMYDLLEALASRPDVWAKTVLFITYDENDGFFD
ncbi:MAG: alkaline phosphatase family protein, partial [Candidatus Dormiibacterota bacterium]